MSINIACNTDVQQIYVGIGIYDNIKNKVPPVKICDCASDTVFSLRWL